MNATREIDPVMVDEAVKRFREIIRKNEPGGREFAGFRQGIIDGEEGYKTRVQEEARRRLMAETWERSMIGTGDILAKTISAIEIEGNNLLTWDDRNGPGTRAHMRLVEATESINARTEMESLLFDLYQNQKRDELLFARCIALLGQNYPILGYLWFINNPEKFTPLRPQGLQRGLETVGSELRLAGKCSWENYSAFLDTLKALIPLLKDRLELGEVRLIDAHSFIWVIGSWKTPEAGTHGRGSTFGDIEKAAYIIASNIMNTVKHSSGQVVERTVKEKSTDMSHEELMKHVEELLRDGDGTCALSGLPFQLPPNATDSDLQASPDRIDSDMGYTRGNIQMTCWFANRWKGSDSNLNFQRLLEIVRS